MSEVYSAAAVLIVYIAGAVAIVIHKLDRIERLITDRRAEQDDVDQRQAAQMKAELQRDQVEHTLRQRTPAPRIKQPERVSDETLLMQTRSINSDFLRAVHGGG